MEQINSSFTILDCTIRDGGYYTNWDFERSLIDTYFESCNNLPIEYLEIGYRSIPLNGYFGEYFYLPITVLRRIKQQTQKKLAVILNEKDVRVENLNELLEPCIDIVDLVRIAVDPKEINRATKLAENIKMMGFKVAFNVMYMSKWKYQNDFFPSLEKLNGLLDYFYLVDSYGGIYPHEVKEAIVLVRNFLPNVKLGFHGHNNLELALINTITAIQEGCSIVDATITGMGRGAGNLKTELLLTSLNSKGLIEVDFNSLSKVVDSFILLQSKFEWGTNLPYMFSGANSLPQKDVMDWVGKRYFSFNSIIRAMQNQKGTNTIINKFSPLLKNNFKFKVLIVGGGDSVTFHKDAIKEYLFKNDDILIIHASSKNASLFRDISNQQYFCLLGNEGYRMESVFDNQLPNNSICILPPLPRKMGTYIPKAFNGKIYELENYTFFSNPEDSNTAIALQLAFDLGANQVQCVGYDGYSNLHADGRQQELFAENQLLFSQFIQYTQIKVSSLTQSAYELEINSIYTCI
jgi:4-hydroxy 2-oxovalerate aldolase